jgi:hypothetical protein
MRTLRRYGWLIVGLSWFAPVYAAELTAPPSAKTETPAAESTAPSKSKEDSSKDSDNAETRLIPPDTELIDIPTASILDYGAFSSRSRFFTSGGVVEWVSFGVFQRLNIGASLNVDKFIGTGEPVQVTRPDLQVKFRFYDGTPILPALAVGFDGQGYFYNRVDHLYNQRDHGLYLVGSQEILVPGFQVHAGMNIPDFDNNPLFGFMGADYNIKDKVLVMAEWDNINNFYDSRLNLGFRVYITTNFSVDFAVRSIGRGGTYDNGLAPGNERVVTLKYIGNF